jgi:AcrR family transcriptional regulator
MTATARKKGVRAAQKEARPGEIAAAALKLFARDGFAGTRLEEVAKRAGISKGTIYLYFDTKEDLFKACVRETVGTHLAETTEIAATFTGPTEELLREVVVRMASRLSQPEFRTILLLMISEGKRFPELVNFYHAEVLSQGLAMLTKILERGVERSELRKTAVMDFPMLLMSPAIMYVIWDHLFGAHKKLDLSDVLHAHLDAMLEGIKA